MKLQKALKKKGRFFKTPLYMLIGTLGYFKSTTLPVLLC
jgi:hypothetical protein